MSAASPAPDRSRPPQPDSLRAFEFPPVERVRLSNGIPLLVASSQHFPVVTFSVLVEAGGAREPEPQAGLATLTAELLESGAGARSGADIAEHVEALGADLDIAATWDVAHIGVSALAARIEPALEIVAELLRAPSFPLDEVERLRAERLAEVLQRRASPRGLANEMALRFVFAEQSPFARPLSGTEETVSGLTQADLRAFHAERYAAGGAALIVAGALDASEAQRLAERYLGDWGGATAPAAAPPYVAPRDEAVQIAIVDRPGSVQSELRVGHVGVERSTPDFFALAVMNAILGGTFSSRLNLNLRERHGFTYGVQSSFSMRRQPGPFLVSTAVQTEVTAGALCEIVNEIERIRAEPVAPAELDDARNYLAGVFPLRLQTTHGIAARLTELVVFHLPDDYLDSYRERILDVEAPQVLDVARRRLQPHALAIVVVGDAREVRGPLEQLGLGPVCVYSSDGRPQP